MVQLGMNFIATFVGVGGFLLGYDVGIFSGVLAMDSFKEVFRYDEDLDESEQFLRDYMINKSWLETTSMQHGSSGGRDSPVRSKRRDHRSCNGRGSHDPVAPPSVAHH